MSEDPMQSSPPSADLVPEDDTIPGDEPANDDAESDYGPPFEAKTFGGSFVWARSDGYVASVLRIREGENVAVSTNNRRDMVMMLTGGRAMLEVQTADDIERSELMPASPLPIAADCTYRLIALTAVELFTVYRPLAEC